MAGLLWYRSYMDSLANTSGYYPDIHAGHADRVTELTLEAPYLVRETPAGYNQLELMELVGGSVAWNQLMEHGNFDSTDGFNFSNFDNRTISGGVLSATGHATGELVAYISRSVTTQTGHKILLAIDVKCSSGIKTRMRWPAVTSAKTISANTWTRVAIIGESNSSYNTTIGLQFDSVLNATYEFKNYVCYDLTQMFGSTIADYVYSLEQATAGSGIAWLKSYGYFTEDYYAYSAPALEHVKTTAHITKDADDNVLGTYPFDSGLLLRGVLKLDNGALIYDGDTYEPDGTVTRYFGIRTYQAGDESLTNAITDGTDTVYELGAPTTESADPYTAMQDVEVGGTEEFVTGNNVPVGNVSVYRRA